MNDRLPPQSLEWIDRSRELRFTFEGRSYTGFAGDTITSALWANGERVLGRSFKYHRPRGIFSLANCDTNAMFALDDTTNVRGDITLLADGMNVRGINTFGGLRKDWGRYNEWLGRFMPVGFYYKAFHKPRQLFPYWEDFFRRMAGLGAIDPKAPAQLTPKNYGFCDVLVVGAGPAGLAAAKEAAGRGASVLLVEEQPRLGGSLVYQWHGRDTAARTLHDLAATCEQDGRITVRTGTAVVGAFADRWMALVDDTRLTKLRARTVVLATGSHEQPAVFHNNDLPGVMLGSAVQRLIHQYAVRPFQRGVVLAANAEGYRVALDLLKAGIEVAAVADLRSQGEPSPVGEELRKQGTMVYLGYGVHEAEPAAGKAGVQGAVLCPVTGSGVLDASRPVRVACDGVVVSVGWTPADSLLRQAGGRMAYDANLEQYLPTELPEGYWAAGQLNGIYDLDAQIADGTRAGAAAAIHAGYGSPDVVLTAPREHEPHNHPYPVFSHPNGKNFVDLDEDIQLKDFEHAVEEGYDNPELLKRYTTVGMGPSQGKHSNLLSARILQYLGKLRLTDSALTTARPFTTPVAVKFLAGKQFFPLRRTPMHAWHESEGAVFLYAGNWLRPEYYRMPRRSREDTIADEALAVRMNVGIIDLGTLGKIEVLGRDAVTFLERIHTGVFAKLKVGMTRYGITCDDAGIVTGDGVVARLGENHFYMTTTTTGADTAYRDYQRLIQLWNLQVTLIHLTGAYTAVNVAGPRCPAVLGRVTDIDLNPEAFPYLGFREGLVAGVPARVIRVGFVGELGYEIHVPATMGLHLWNALLEAGHEDDIRPFGIEAQRLLRLEKGHFIVSQDTDPMTHAFELDASWAIKMDKPFFIGQRSLRVLKEKPKPRRSGVGFTLAQGYSGPVPNEGNLILDDGKLIGRVTSISFSRTLKRHIGLAILEAAYAGHGQAFRIKLNDGTYTEAQVTELPFYDAEGARQKGFAPTQAPLAPVTPSRSRSIFAPTPADGAAVMEVQSMPVTRYYGHPEEEAGRTRDLALCDTSAFQRFGIRLLGDTSGTDGLGVLIPEHVLDASPLSPAGLVARSGLRELFIEDRTVEGSWAARFLGAGRSDGNYFAFRREDAGVLLTGARADEVMRQVCSYPFAESPSKLIMTQIAAAVAWVIHETIDGCPVYRISFGNASAHYLWTVLEGIVTELGGAAVGWDAVKPFLQPLHKRDELPIK